MAKFRIGIIGAGSRGIRAFGVGFVKNFPDDLQVVAVADPNGERASAAVNFLGVKADVHADAHDLVGRKDIDAVVITSPDYLHEEHCLAALKKGKHLLVDKPLATTAKGCQRIVEEAKRANRLVYMGFNLRQDIVLRKLKELIAGNAFGEVFSLHANEHYDGGRTYFSRWNRLRKYSGGLWCHKGSHDFDILNWFMGDIRPAKVSCFANVFTFNEKHLPFKPRRGVKPGPTCSACKYGDRCPDRDAVGGPGDPEEIQKMFGPNSARVDGYHKDLCMYLSDKDTHDQGVAIVEYENGATAMHSEYFATPITNREYMIEGTLAHGRADLHGNWVAITQRWTKNEIRHDVKRPTGGHGGADPKMHREFVACLKGGITPSATVADGAWSVAISEAAEISRAEGRVVKISELLDVKSPLLRP